MGKRIELQPAWLVGLLNQWAKHGLASELGGLGYASGSGWMRGLKSSPASCIDPTGYAARDFSDLDAAIEDLRDRQPKWLMAVLMYYKPWGIQAAIAEGHPHGNSTFYERLHKGHAELAWFMDARKEARRGAAITILTCELSDERY